MCALLFNCAKRVEIHDYPNGKKEKNTEIKTESEKSNKISKKQKEIIVGKADESFLDSELEIYQQGVASWYGDKFHGRQTSSGEIFDKNKMTAAHKDLPLGSIVRVDNLENGRSVTVKINDRGPFIKGRIIDLSEYGAKKLGFYEKGTALVSIRILKREKLNKEPFEEKIKLTEEKLESETIEISDKNSKSLYYIQIGAFAIKENAKKFLKKYRELLSEINIEFTIEKKENLNIIITKNLFSYVEALLLEEKLKDKGLDCFLLKK